MGIDVVSVPRSSKEMQRQKSGRLTSFEHALSPLGSLTELAPRSRTPIACPPQRNTINTKTADQRNAARG